MIVHNPSMIQEDDGFSPPGSQFLGGKPRCFAVRMVRELRFFQVTFQCASRAHRRSTGLARLLQPCFDLTGGNLQNGKMNENDSTHLWLWKLVNEINSNMSLIYGTSNETQAKPILLRYSSQNNPNSVDKPNYKIRGFYLGSSLQEWLDWVCCQWWCRGNRSPEYVFTIGKPLIQTDETVNS